MSKKTLRIGTRGSNLALWQAEAVKSALEKVTDKYNFDIRVSKTKGDIVLDVALAKIGTTGLFTKELEYELQQGNVDMVVHSYKDMPTQQPDFAKVQAVLRRGEHRDALVSTNGKTLATLDQTDIIATSSVRRKAILLSINPKLNIIDIRGNVNTRLRKMDEGHCNVMIMAAAGLQRLGLDERISELLDDTRFVPAPAQGIVAVEINKGNEEMATLLDKINDKGTWCAAVAERAFLRKLEGGCQAPIGALATMDCRQITLTGFIASVDGSQQYSSSAEGTNGMLVGVSLAEHIGKLGGKQIIADIANRNA